MKRMFLWHDDAYRHLMRPSRTRAITLFCTVLVIAIGYGLGGIGVAIAAMILALLPVAWVFDNDSGTFLILATLFVIVIGIMVLLIGLMAIIH